MTQKHRLPKALTRSVGDGINVNPLQRGGRLYPEARQALHEWGDGYSVCDFCDGRLDSIKKPPLANFIQDTLPAFLDTDVARVTNGAREAIFLVMHAMCSEGATIIIDQNAHYTTYVAAERNNLTIKEVPHSGYPAFTINPDAYAEAITTVKTDSGQLPQLIVLTYPDGNYGNLVKAQRVAQIANEFNIPFLLNAAYAVGRMPLSAKRIGCDFIVGSGHKSMAASGPIGVLGLRDEYREKLLRASRYAKAKEVELLGCTARGATIMTLLASFPHVSERTHAWDQEVKQARWFIRELERSGFLQLGQRPHNHDLMFLEALPFYTISQKHPKKRFFLYQALKQRGIFGIKAGLTKHFKLSTYQLPRADVTFILEAFREILDENRKYL